MFMNMQPPEPGQCRYDGRYGNYCHRPGIPEEGGLCYWHSRRPKTKEAFLEEVRTTGEFEGVIISNLDLSNTDISGIWFRGFTAIRCSFDGSKLVGTRLGMSTFDGCNFIRADFSSAIIEFSRLTNCVFIEAKMEKAKLLSVDLTNSDLGKVNLSGGQIGQMSGIIVVPGIGNPEQHLTKIDGANFRGANFENTQIDAMYLNAPNLQEPLNALWLKNMSTGLEEARAAKTNDEKKRTLEDLAAKIITKIPGLSIHARDKRRLTDEIDLIVINESNTLFIAGLGGPLIVECKNESEPVGSDTINQLSGKIPFGGVGVIVTSNRLTADAEKLMCIQTLQGRRCVFLDISDLEGIVQGDISPEKALINRYYYVLSR